MYTMFLQNIYVKLTQRWIQRGGRGGWSPTYPYAFDAAPQHSLATDEVEEEEGEISPPPNVQFLDPPLHTVKIVP